MPVCGYTLLDALLHGDHNRCEGVIPKRSTATANQLLLAAAPNMFKALKVCHLELINILDSFPERRGGSCEVALDAVKAAIKKATEVKIDD